MMRGFCRFMYSAVDADDTWLCERGFTQRHSDADDARLCGPRFKQAGRLMLMMRGLCAHSLHTEACMLMLMMHGSCGPTFTQMMRGLCERRYTQRPANADAARVLRDTGLCTARLKLMMHGFGGHRFMYSPVDYDDAWFGGRGFTQRHADTDDARPLRAQAYKEAG